MVRFTDPFTGTGAGLGASWSTYTGVNPLQRVADVAEPDVINAPFDGIESCNTSVANDQWAEGTVATMGPLTEYNSVGVEVRWAAPNTVNGYMLLLDTTTDHTSYRLSIQKYTAAVLSQVTSSPSNFVNVTLLGNEPWSQWAPLLAH